jgi:diguanylate cyclase (GGDEF)-like protein
MSDKAKEFHQSLFKSLSLFVVLLFLATALAWLTVFKTVVLPRAENAAAASVTVMIAPPVPLNYVFGDRVLLRPFLAKLWLRYLVFPLTLGVFWLGACWLGVFLILGRYQRLFSTALEKLEDNLKEVYLGDFNVVFGAPEFAWTQRIAGLMNQMLYFFKQHTRERELENQRDPLTRLYTRRYLLERLEKEIKRAKRYKSPMSFMMIDIDHFKKFNDEHGHQMGDKVLAQTAQILMSATRETDVVGRYGGEEIGVLLLETYLRDAVVVAEKLRQAVAAAAYSYRGATVSVTLSFGVTSLLGGEFDSPQEVVKRADQALYEAKQNGRNQVRRTI